MTRIKRRILFKRGILFFKRKESDSSKLKLMGKGEPGQFCKTREINPKLLIPPARHKL
jgi:hypothetical protein